MNKCPFQTCDGRFVCHCNKEKTEVVITGLGMKAGQEIEDRVNHWKDLFNEIKGINISSQVEHSVCKVSINLLDCKKEDREQAMTLLKQEFKCVKIRSHFVLPTP
jgi:hypothetical protein